MTMAAVAEVSQVAAPTDILVTQNMALVRRLARQVHARGGKLIELEELVQTGLMALVQASRTFVQRGEASFTTYATLRVRGAMIDLLRAHATINRGAMRRRKALRENEAALVRTLGRRPTNDEIAANLGISAAQYRASIDNSQPVYLEPLDSVYSDRSDWFASSEPSAHDRLEAAALREDLVAALARLPKREALVLQLYFVEGLTLEDIGQALEVGAARVCQIKKQALERLRARLDDSWN